MVLNWLDTATPQRRGSVDQGPDESTGAGSAVFAEARLSAKPTAFDGIHAASAAELANALICPHADAAPAAEPASSVDRRLPGATRATPPAGKAGAYLYDGTEQGSGYGAALELLELNPAASVPAPPGQVDDASANPTAPGECSCDVSSLAAAAAAAAGSGTHGPVLGSCHASWHTDGGSWGIPSGNLQAADAAWTTMAEAGALRRACTAGGERGLGGGGGGGGVGLSPQWSLPLQGERHRLPRTVEWPVAAQAPPQGQRQHVSPGGGARPSSAGLGSSAAVAAAASIWMPAGAALCHSWDLEPLPPGLQAALSQQQLQVGQHSIRPAAAAHGGGGGTLLAALSTPGCGAHAYPLPHPLQHQHPHQHQHPVSCSGSSYLGVPELAGMRSGSASLRSAFNAASGGGGGGGGFDGGGGGGGAAAFQSCGSAPMAAQEGAEWCNIPLGSPVRTPNKGDGSRASNR